MGGHSYSNESRSHRTKTYLNSSFNENFQQMKVRRVHESMDPKGVKLRESRDSTIHPITYPILFGMDVTGSMRKIPEMLLKTGLPTIITTIIQRGIPSPALMFAALGDSHVDKAPFQIGQFESGDKEMDMWLQRTWPEGGGGANEGESYLWLWYFAAYHTVTDAWEKRQQKGLLVSFGDEPCLETIGKAEYEEVMGEPDPQLGLEFPLRAVDLLSKAQEKWNIYHIHLSSHRETPKHWKEWLGQELIEEGDPDKIPNIVADLAINTFKVQHSQPTDSPKKENDETKITL